MIKQAPSLLKESQIDLETSLKEIERLREALAQAEQERDLYRKALYEHERKLREFEDVDIASLEAMSAGIVEMFDEARTHACPS